VETGQRASPRISTVLSHSQVARRRVKHSESERAP
jgi:hypothetical protein